MPSENVIFLARVPERDRVSDSGTPSVVEVYKMQLLTSGGKPTPIPWQLSGLSGYDNHGNLITLPTKGEAIIQGGGGTEEETGGTITNSYFVTALDATRDPDPSIVYIEVTFTPYQIDGNNTARYNVTITGDGVESTTPITRWASNNPGPAGNNGIIVNSANDVLPGQTREIYDSSLTITYQCDADQFSSDYPTITSFLGKINSDDVSFTIQGVAFTFNPYQLKCKNRSFSITVNQVADVGNVPTFTVKVEFLYRKDSIDGSGDGYGWLTKIADYGTRQLVSGHLQKIPCTDDHNIFVTEPVPLNGSGLPLTVTSSTPEILLPTSGTPNSKYVTIAMNSYLNEFDT